MTANNGWPGKPGVPLNPERDGWHWVESSEGIVPALWARPLWRHCRDFWDQRSSEWMEERGWRYLGPCLTPEEATALQRRCEEAERERDALRRDTSQQVTTDEMVRRLQNLGDWQASDRIEAQAAEITRLRAAFATARREGMEEARAIFNDAIENTTLEGTLLMRQIDAAIRAAAGEGKP